MTAHGGRADAIAQKRPDGRASHEPNNQLLMVMITSAQPSAMEAAPNADRGWTTALIVMVGMMRRRRRHQWHIRRTLVLTINVVDNARMTTTVNGGLQWSPRRFATIMTMILVVAVVVVVRQMTRCVCRPDHRRRRPRRRTGGGRRCRLLSSG